MSLGAVLCIVIVAPLALIVGLGLLLRLIDHLARRRFIARELATGSTLDRLGAVYGMRRKPRERDVDYRERIARSITNVHKRDDWAGR